MAEPKPAPEKPNLVAVAPEPQAEPSSRPPALGAAPPTAKPAPAPGKTTPAAQAPRERKGPGWTVWLLVLLVAAFAVTAWVQTERLGQSESRVTDLSEQVLGLQAQLSVANTQIQTYEMQRGQVREAVSDIAQRVLLLNELVGGADTPAPAPEAEPVP